MQLDLHHSLMSSSTKGIPMDEGLWKTISLGGRAAISFANSGIFEVPINKFIGKSTRAEACRRVMKLMPV